MSDLENFKALLDKANASFEEVSRAYYMTEYPETTFEPRKKTATVVRAMPGYRAHFEAEFDAQGNILSIGQWEEM